jgi:hypothetical protein
MARLNLQTKKPPLKIDRKISSKAAYIPINDPANFHLLKDNRHEDEKFSRVDKFWVNHYWQVGTEWLCEKVFYPSPFGVEEIQKENNHPCTDLYERLKSDGSGLHGERPTPKIHQKQTRIKLKCKPQRMTLTCKEED